MQKHLSVQKTKGLQICHIDGNKQNPVSENLRYDTPKGNAQDRLLHGTDPIGQNNPNSKYEDVIILKIKALLQEYAVSEVARIMDIPRTTVSSIAHGKRWNHI